MKRALFPLLGILTLSACATTEDPMERFQGMTCGELAVAIDYERKSTEQARIRALGHGIAGALGEESERTGEEIAAALANAQANSKEDLVTELRVLSASRGCTRR